MESYFFKIFGNTEFIIDSIISFAFAMVKSTSAVTFIDLFLFFRSIEDKPSPKLSSAICLTGIVEP